MTKKFFTLKYLRNFLVFITLSLGIIGFNSQAFNVDVIDSGFQQNSNFGGNFGLLAVALPVAVIGFYGVKKLCGKCCFEDNHESELERRAKMLGISSDIYKTKESLKEPELINFNSMNLPAFSQWADKCKKLPKFVDAIKNNYKDAALTKDEFLNVLAGFLDAMGKSSINKKENWIKELFVKEDFSIMKASEKFLYSYMPANKIFAQRIDLPKDARLHTHADIHGDIHSLMAYLNDLYAKGVIDENFKILDNNYMAFLGDYVDRGVYCAEVLYTIFRLKIANPEKVFVLRGNHEDINQNMKRGFIRHAKSENKDARAGELLSKFVFESEYYVEHMLIKLYNLMPVALFVGCINDFSCLDCRDYAMLFHGGIEKTFYPGLLFKDRESNCKYMTVDLPLLGGVAKLEALGLLWNDFCIKDTEKDKLNSDRPVVSKKTTIDYLERISSKAKNYKISCIIRGHEHAGKTYKQMVKHKGIYNTWAAKDGQWNGIGRINFNRNCPVWVLNASPDNIDDSDFVDKYKNCDYDAYATLQISGNKLEDWFLEPHNVKVFN